MNLGGIKISSIEIESACSRVAGVTECAAVAVNPSQGGPSALIIFVVLAADVVADAGGDRKLHSACKDKSNYASVIKQQLQHSIRESISPLFRVRDVVIRSSLARTASGKIIRRVLRDEYTSSPSYCFKVPEHVSLTKPQAKLVKRFFSTSDLSSMQLRDSEL